jgi:thiamine-monophosphate kinase
MVLHELKLIEWLARTVGDADALRDDAYWDAETRHIYTTDMMVEGRHFNAAWFSPQDVGWKAAAVNISDIAAMGGRLKCLLVSLAIPTETDFAWIQAFYEGLSEACTRFGGVIAGGDTVGGADRLVVNVAAIGECPAGYCPGRRFNARPGDYVLSTGFHGLSHTGLRAFQGGEAGYAESKTAHLRPQPCVEAGLALAARFERYALMDSSDGLADALIKIAQSSGQALLIDESAVPLHPEVMAYARAHRLDPWQVVLYGGEDFELIATVPHLDDALFPAFRVIGRVVPPEEAPGSGKASGAWLADSAMGRVRVLDLDKTYRHFEG